MYIFGFIGIHIKIVGMFGLYSSKDCCLLLEITGEKEQQGAEQEGFSIQKKKSVLMKR